MMVLLANTLSQGAARLVAAMTVSKAMVERKFSGHCDAEDMGCPWNAAAVACSTGCTAAAQETGRVSAEGSCWDWLLKAPLTFFASSEGLDMEGCGRNVGAWMPGSRG
jgi:hypothetical protein